MTNESAQGATVAAEPVACTCGQCGHEFEAVPEPRHKLLCGDSTDAASVGRLLGEAKPHLMVTDPPYGVDYDPAWRDESLKAWKKPRSTGKVTNDDRADWSEAWALFPGDVAYVWHGGLHLVEVAQSLLACGLEMRSLIIWAKQHFVIGRGDYHWQTEGCLYVVRKGKTGHYNGDRTQSTLWTIANNGAFGGQVDDTQTGHGTQKPVACMQRPIENNSLPGELVYEPFCGSGTTVVAAERTGRRCFGVEIDPSYCDVVLARFEAVTGEMAYLIERTADSPSVSPADI